MFNKLFGGYDRNRLMVAGAGALALILIIIIIAFSACNSESEPEVSPSPTPVSAAPPPEESPEPVMDTVTIGTVIDVDSVLNVRSTGSKSGDIIGKAKLGEQFTVLNMNVGDDEAWHQILYNGAAAYVSIDYLDVVERQVVRTESPIPDEASEEPPETGDATGDAE